MKNILSTAVRTIMIVLCTAFIISCSSNRQLATATEHLMQSHEQLVPLTVSDEITAIEEEIRLIHAQTAREVARREAAIALSQAPPVVATTLQFLPCMSFSTQQSDTYLFGFGVSDGQRTQRNALLVANSVAISDIATRFVGVLEQLLEWYVDQGLTSNGTKLDQSSIRAIARNAGQRIVNQMAHVLCREIAVDRNNMYVGYIAVAVSIASTVSEADIILNEALGLDFSRAQFREQLREELLRQERARLAQ